MAKYQFEHPTDVYDIQDREEFSRRRCEIIEALLDDGFVPGYGFGRHVADACELEEVPHNRYAISRDLKKVKKRLYEEDGATGWGRDYLLSLLGDELSGLMKVDMKGATADDMIKMARARSALIEKIARIEGVRAPTKKLLEVKHVHEVWAKVPTHVFKKLEAAKDVDEAERILVHEVGPEDARLMIAAITAGPGDG